VNCLFDLARGQRVERVVLREWVVAGQWSRRGGCRGWGEILSGKAGTFGRYAQDDKRGMRVREGMGLKLAAWRREVGTALVARWLEGPDLYRSLRDAQNARDQAGTSSGPGLSERIRRRWEARECEAVGRVVGVGFVVRREKKKKQIPPDKTRDSRTSSGARRCAPRQGRGGRNDNLRAFAWDWAELIVGRGKWVPKAAV
jgi:hypothetical protein